MYENRRRRDHEAADAADALLPHMYISRGDR